MVGKSSTFSAKKVQDRRIALKQVHIDGHIRFMALRQKDGVAKTKRNDRCPVAGGRKIKYFHGK